MHRPKNDLSTKIAEPPPRCPACGGREIDFSRLIRQDEYDTWFFYRISRVYECGCEMRGGWENDNVRVDGRDRWVISVRGGCRVITEKAVGK